MLCPWLVLETRLYIRDSASIRTSDQDPQLVMGTRLLFEIRLVLEVLRYVCV